MAMLDYGALLRVDGKFVNKDKGLFMDMKDMCGFNLEAAYDDEADAPINISGSFFVYAGEPDLLLCFYKNTYYIISNGIILKSSWIYSWCFNKEVFFVNEVEFTLEVIDKEIRKEFYDRDFDEWEREGYINHYGKKLGHKRINRWFKRRKKCYDLSKGSNKYLMSWNYNGKRYEVIFGYGIDPTKKVYDDIKEKSYGYTKNEIEFIDKWFKEN